VKVARAREPVGFVWALLWQSSPKRRSSLFRYKASEGIGERPSAVLALRDAPGKSRPRQRPRWFAEKENHPFTLPLSATFFCSLSAPPAAAVVRTGGWPMHVDVRRRRGFTAAPMHEPRECGHDDQ